MAAEGDAPQPYDAAVALLEREATNPDVAAVVLGKSVMLETSAAGSTYFRTLRLGKALATSALFSPRSIELIEGMASQGFDVDTRIRLPRVFGGDAVWTLLHYGIAAGAPRFVASMLGLGADPTVRLPHDVDYHGRTRLVSAFGLVANELHRRQDRDERASACERNSGHAGLMARPSARAAAVTVHSRRRGAICAAIRGHPALGAWLLKRLLGAARKAALWLAQVPAERLHRRVLL